MNKYPRRTFWSTTSGFFPGYNFVPELFILSIISAKEEMRLVKSIQKSFESGHRVEAIILTHYVLEVI